MNKNEAKSITKQRRDAALQEPMRVYSDLLSLVDQALHARIIADAMWKFKHERGRKTGFNNSVISFSHVALENLTVQQLWKLFDKRNSVLHVWDVVENLPYPALLVWLEKNLESIKNDAKLIEEWRHGIVSHRGKIAYYAPDEYKKRFTEGRTSEKRLHDFLLKFLCQIKFEMQQISIEETMKEFQLKLGSFEDYIKREMKEIYKEV